MASGDCHTVQVTGTGMVLTLLILEFGFGAVQALNKELEKIGLNPSYTGIWLRGKKYSRQTESRTPSLNPSYTGIWLRGPTFDAYGFYCVCLNPSYTGIWLRGSTKKHYATI